MFTERLKSERKRLKMNQENFGRACGVELLAQSNYERGKRQPDSKYLQKAHELGVDTHYLITGQRLNNALTTDEMFLLQEFRNLPSEQQRLMLRFLLAGFSGLNKAVINGSNVRIENSFNN